MAQISISRRAAHAVLLAVEAGIGHADDLLRDDPLMAAMSPVDRRLTTKLVLGVLRWQTPLDDQIRQCFSKPKAKLDPAVLITLRMGAFQLLHLDRIPAHAAIDESVELTKRSGFRSASGLVNAVLRKLAQQSTRALAPEGSSSSDVAAHPAWMVNRWTGFFGAATSAAICVHDQSQPSSAIRLSAPEVERELVEAGISLLPGHLLTAARLVESGDLTQTAAFREGRIRIQDEGSQLVAEIAALPNDSGPEKILDCCAAPGGKTLILAERNPSAGIVACEASRPRLKELRNRLAGLGERIDCRLADATALHFDSEFDIVLADVPCSGTGTLSRNPEIRHRLQPDDLPRQAERQRAILASALRATRPGGRVVYSTCSLEPEENEKVVAAVVPQHSNVRITPLATVLEALRHNGILNANSAEGLQSSLTPEGFLRLIPGAFGTDGFFIALFEKG
jgi:16S rRNA (cytosine967-C5)-methyltransferase